MKAKRLKIALCFFVILLTNSTSVYSLSVETHKTINKTVAKGTMNGFSFDSYLKNNLSLSEGIEELFDSETVFTWLQLGGRYEDKPPWTIPYARSINHFHDPISNMGYNVNGETNLLEIIDNYSIFRYLYPILNLIGNIDIKSSIDWALLPKETQYFGYYSWNDVMGYYKEALTSPDQEIRSHNFAETFRGLGQLMHHVQDASSPAHTRNDQHLSQEPEKNYEAWVRDNKSTDVDISGYTPVFFDGDMDSFYGFANSMAYFIDTNQYFGTNPAVTAGTDIGLSEYTNANFFSEQTNAFESTIYTYPQVPDDPMNDPTHIENRNYVNQYGDDYPRQYYKKDSDGETNNNTGYLLSAVDYLEYYRKSLNPLGRRKLIVPLLDYHVYGAYADLLLPRAIGYSAGLLNYFFRGEIEVIQIPDSNNIKIKNNSSEVMDGIFTLYYDAIDGNRKQVENGETNNEWSLSLQAGQTSDELSFTEPTDFTEGTQYTLVFKGKLGNESNTVVGNVFDSNPKGCTYFYREKSTSGRPLSAVYNAFLVEPWGAWIATDATATPPYYLRNTTGPPDWITTFRARELKITSTIPSSGTFTVQARLEALSGPTWAEGGSKTFLESNPARYGLIWGGGWKNMFTLTGADAGEQTVIMQDSNNYVIPGIIGIGIPDKGWKGNTGGALRIERHGSEEHCR